VDPVEPIALTHDIQLIESGTEGLQPAVSEPIVVSAWYVAIAPVLPSDQTVPHHDGKSEYNLNQERDYTIQWISYDAAQLGMAHSTHGEVVRLAVRSIQDMGKAKVDAAMAMAAEASRATKRRRSTGSAAEGSMAKPSLGSKWAGLDGHHAALALLKAHGFRPEEADAEVSRMIS
jgi:hypothetical protein